MTTNIMTSLGHLAAKQADWRTSALKALRLGAKGPVGALGRYAGLGLAGEGAATGLTALTEGSKPFHEHGQKLRGWGDKYKLPGTAGATTPTKDIPASLGTLGSVLTRPVKTIATALGGYGGEGSPLAYKGPTRTIKDSTKSRGPADRDTTDSITRRETAALSTKGRRKWDEVVALRDLMSRRGGQLEQDYRSLERPRSTRAGETFDDILERNEADRNMLEEQRKSLEFGGNYPDRFGSGVSPDRKLDYSFGEPGKTQLDYQQQLKALMDELGSDRNVQLTPEHVGRSAAVRQMLEGISGRGPQQHLGAPLSEHDLYRFPDSGTRDRDGSID